MQIREGLWTPESVSAFWQYQGRRKDLTGYFTYQVGAGVAAFVGHTNRLKPGAAVLDYGCGPGFLIQHLLQRGVNCWAADSSAEAVELANRRYAGSPGWKGAFALNGSCPALPVAGFDVVTCIETLEHLADDSLQPVVREIFRYLKPGGLGVFSTPFQEDLKRNKTFCPFCNTEYHKVQHQRSFDAPQLSALLAGRGFTVLFCRDLDFGEFQRELPGWKDVSIRSLAWAVRKKLREWTDRVSAVPFPNGRTFNYRLKPGPHLCAVVERPVRRQGYP